LIFVIIVIIENRKNIRLLFSGIRKKRIQIIVIVAAFLAIGCSPTLEWGCPYNAGSGKYVSVSKLIEVVTELTRCNKPVQAEAVRMRPPLSEVRALLADSSCLSAQTGWRPTVTLREGLERTIEWWSGRLSAGHVRTAADYIA